LSIAELAGRVETGPRPPRTQRPFPGLPPTARVQLGAVADPVRVLQTRKGQRAAQPCRATRCGRACDVLAERELGASADCGSRLIVRPRVGECKVTSPLRSAWPSESMVG